MGGLSLPGAQAARLNSVVLSWFTSARRKPACAPIALQVGEHSIALHFRRNPRARRYVLRLEADGAARVTIPRGGSEMAAREFVARHLDWLRRQRERWAVRPAPDARWLVGTEILFRGEPVKIAVEDRELRTVFTFADQSIHAAGVVQDCRPLVERHLRRLATAELPPRVLKFARLHAVAVQRVVVRNQKSRWGSCSRRGTISLNWRLIQAPVFVADYIILHELMHLRQMNHSARFWREVEAVCPDFREAERWLKAHGQLLR